MEKLTIQEISEAMNKGRDELEALFKTRKAYDWKHVGNNEGMIITSPHGMIFSSTYAEMPPLAFFMLVDSIDTGPHPTAKFKIESYARMESLSKGLQRKIHNELVKHHRPKKCVKRSKA